ncbi:MAG TPA: TIGR03435 family protein [Candidatus Acidoferrales bacterium]|nr:TIGR03435 family protein [Candidatus Acidoferrales bacterium]
MSRGRVIVKLLAALVAVAAASAQTRPAFDSFEVATIKPTALDWTGGRFIRMQTAHQLIARNHTLKTLIAAAYNLNFKSISGGPAWVDSDHFDILAKAPGEARPALDEQMAMLRKLLADRFGLAFHREPKEMPIYALTVARGGCKLTESTVSPDASPEGPPALVFVVSPQLVRLPGRSATVAEIASVMQRAALDRPVVDRTGLSARYDFDLEFMPDETLFGGMLGKPPAAGESTKPGLFAAIQEQLGLRLEATRGQVDLFVIDKAKQPSEN